MEIFTTIISGLFGLVFFLIWLALVVCALWSIFKNPSFNQNTKLLWVIIILIAPILGSLLYLFWGRTQSFL